MSTRRARIKAVASLPVRRKNADSKVPKSLKQAENDVPPTSEGIEIVQSPRKPVVAGYFLGSPTTHTVQADKTVAKTDKEADISPGPAESPRLKVPGALPSTATNKNDIEAGEPTSPLNLTGSSLETQCKSNGSSRKYVERAPFLNSSPAVGHNFSPRIVTPSVIANSLLRNRLNTKEISPGFSQPILNVTSAIESTTENYVNTGASFKPNENNLNHHSVVACAVSSSSPVRYVPSSNLEQTARRAAGEPRPDSPGPVDGIVPLATARSRAAAVDLLKSEIISESAEVLFDPIVPLPSPGRPRPKLRPAPRLATVRRNSVQGSASESEDEHKRSLASAGAAGPAGGAGAGPAGGAGAGRTRHDSQSSLSTHHSQQSHSREGGRNDSVCSAPSHATPTLLASPLKEKHLASRWKRGDSCRQLSALRRKQRARGPGVQRDQLTMYDLIFYNPTTDPIVETEEDKAARLKPEASGEQRAAASGEQRATESEAEDDPPPGAGAAAAEGTEGEEGGEVEGDAEPAPVPQIKLGPNGEVIIDEQSLVIERTGGPRRLSASVVREWGGRGGGRYSRAPRTKQWADAETVRFYRALAAVGTDFSLMQPLFPDRSRRDLKMKFKKEERLNGAQIDKALSVRVSFRAEQLAAEFARERREAAERERRRREEAQEQVRREKEQVRAAQQAGVRLGKASKAMAGIFPSHRPSSHVLTADDIIEESVRAPRKRKSAAPPPPAPPPPRPAPPVEPATPPPPAPLGRYASAAQAYSLPAHVNPLAVARTVPPGSLVCLTVPDPGDATKKLLQTYVSDGRGKLTPVNLPSAVLSSVVDYMKSGAGPSARASPAPATPAAPSAPAARTPPSRARHNSYTIMNL